MAAATENRVEIIRLLLTHKDVDVNLKDVVSLLSGVCLRFLLKSLHVLMLWLYCAQNGKTALQLAKAKDYIKVVELLEQFSISSEDRLLQATERNNLASVQDLLANGQLNVNARNKVCKRCDYNFIAVHRSFWFAICCVSCRIKKVRCWLQQTRDIMTFLLRYWSIQILTWISAIRYYSHALVLIINCF